MPRTECLRCGATDEMLVRGDFGMGDGLYCKDAMACELRAQAKAAWGPAPEPKPKAGGHWSDAKPPKPDGLHTGGQAFREATTRLFYLMLAETMPYGLLEELVDRANKLEGELVRSPLLALADELVSKLAAPAAAQGWSKATREWIESFPDRIKGSAHFQDVLRELEGTLPITETAKADIIGEVVRRERGG